MITSLQSEMALLFGFSLSWLYAFEDNCNNNSKLISVVGNKCKEVISKYPSINIENDEMMTQIFKSDTPVYIKDARIDPRTDKKIVHSLAYRSIINCQLFLQGKSLGLLGACSFDTEGVKVLNADEIAYFSALSKIVSISLDRINYREKSLLDPLTGLNNKRGLKVNSDTVLSLAQRNNQRLAVIFIDLDNFKPINDQHGHEVGDQALISFAQSLKRLLRSSDVVARIGGDEFVVLLSGIKNEGCIHQLIEQINIECTELLCHETTFNITFSAGYAVFPEDGIHLDKLVNLADKRMYEIKSMSKTALLPN